MMWSVRSGEGYKGKGFMWEIMNRTEIVEEDERENEEEEEE